MIVHLRAPTRPHRSAHPGLTVVDKYVCRTHEYAILKVVDVVDDVLEEYEKSIRLELREAKRFAEVCARV